MPFLNNIVGVDLGGTNVRAGLVNNKKIESIHSSRISSKADEQTVIDEVITSIEAVFNENVKGIGIGVPSVVDVEKGIIYDVQNIPSWKEVHLKDILEKHFKVPVKINNDANCFAAGEWKFGKALDKKDVAGLILGTGVAAGIICNHSIYEGRNCGAGEFGMIPYLDANYEFYCSGNFFNHFHGIAGETLAQNAADGDDNAKAIFKDYAKHLGNLIKTVLFAIDPEVIVLGGSVSKSFPHYKEALLEQLKDFPYKPVINNIVIDHTEENNIAILGASALFY
jgi:glucokinase